MKFKFNWLVALTVIQLFVSTAVLYVEYTRGSFYEDVEIADIDPDRNERSTPRSFVLPSTPAVAYVQESKQNLFKEGINVEKCIAILRSMGNEIYSDELFFNVELTRAIYYFQVKTSLPVDGRINTAVAKKLGCNK